MSEQQRFAISNGLRRLIELNAPYWGGEAEVIGTYFNSPTRTHQTDCRWLTHQMYKEFWDGIHPPLDRFVQALSQVEVTISRQHLLKMAMLLHEEVEHYVMFATLYEKAAGKDAPKRSPEELRRVGTWSENDELMAVRAGHKRENPDIGQRAYHFTEGGYCALFSEGAKLAGRGGLDDAIARVCTHIYEDEFDHMLLGLLNTDRHDLSEADWDLLGRMTVEQLRCRIRMRNAQFGQPVSPERITELCAGKGTPIPFDYERARRHRVTE